MDFKQFYYELFFDTNKSITRMYTAKQGDTKARGFYVTILQDSVVVPVTTQTMTFYAEKPDKTRTFVEAVKDGDKFRIDLTNQVFAVPGKVKCELTLRGQSGEQISSKTFAMLVDASIQDDSIVSEDERGIIDQAFELANDLIPQLQLLDVELLDQAVDFATNTLPRFEAIDIEALENLEAGTGGGAGRSDLPRLKINQFNCRGGAEYLNSSSGSYILFQSVYHVFSNTAMNTGAIYALEVFSPGRNSQRVLKSYDDGQTWILIRSMTIASATEKYVHIYVAADSETIILMKHVNHANPTTEYHVIESRTSNLLTTLGTLDIGKHKWLSPFSSIDSYYNAGNIIMFAEYCTNFTGVTDMNVWKSTNFGATWTKVFTQPYGNTAGSVGHFHALQLDPHTKHWWLASGDGDLVAKIWRSKDDGATWELMGGGFTGANQTFRTTCFLFEKDYIYYGMDSPTDGVPTYLYRVPKATLDRTLTGAEQRLDTREIVGQQTHDHAIYSLTRTFFPAGFLVTPVREPVSSPDDHVMLQWYSFHDQELHDIAKIPRISSGEQYWGFSIASRYESMSTGTMLLGTSGWGLATDYSMSNNTLVASSFFRAEIII